MSQMCSKNSKISGGYKTVFMLNSAKHEIYSAHAEMPTIMLLCPQNHTLLVLFCVVLTKQNPKHMFVWRNKLIYSLIIIKYPLTEEERRCMFDI